MRTSLELARKLNPIAVGVEVGVGRGDNGEDILTSWKDIRRLYLVDNFEIAWGQHSSESSAGWLAICVDKFKNYKNAELIIKPSLEAVSMFPDNYLDFVYIDGDHRFNSVFADCNAWWKKVRFGGVLCGHDYNFGEVAVLLAVNKFAKRYGLKVYRDFSFRNIRGKSDWWIKK
jgi:hypothetical protein